MTLLGRGSVVINSGGEKIFPEEVESAVRSHPDVMDAIVVGAPDERWGQTVAAIVQPGPGRSPALEDIQQHCRAHIAGYKLPRPLHTVDRHPALAQREARLPVGRPSVLSAAEGRRDAPGPGGRPARARQPRGGCWPVEAARSVPPLRRRSPAARPPWSSPWRSSAGWSATCSAFPSWPRRRSAAGVVANTARLLDGGPRRRPGRWSTAPPSSAPTGPGTVANTPLHTAVLRRPAHLAGGHPGHRARTRARPDAGRPGLQPPPRRLPVHRHHARRHPAQPGGPGAWW